ncbi:Lipid_DES domain-containing protein [Meloidogyne graminicola]|uniref:Lipid_DES domain-containing protein n=1 Tax=Meloidogyne graminicola TaxID=189291 RepID=A0A8T0A1L1_9BILA|nr:Lipid_DES domain-containing protein [Meloidogyne graminicola]
MGQTESSSSSFEWSYTQEPHATRRKQILEKYPQVKQYFGVDESFKFVVVSMVFYQILMAYLLRESSWLLICLQAYFVGGTISHSLTLAVHECSHNLGFGHHKILQNRILGFIANLPMCIPMSISFKKYHLEHHKNLGSEVVDTDVPSEFEANFFVGPLGKFVWLTLQPLFYALRPLSTYKKSVLDFELLNAFIQILFNLAIIKFMGYKAFIYLFGGFIVGLGLHPLAAHFIRKNLPKISKIAPEFYQNLSIHKSWIRLFFDFVIDPNVSLHSRVKRQISPSIIQFYGTGSYATSYVHKFVASIISRCSIKGKECSKGKEE